ncbi:MAG: EAL domain-containing protein [Elainellaceae cyanobacterium]
MTRLFTPWVNASLGVRLSVVFGGITILLSIISSEIAGRIAKQKLEQDISYELTHLAEQMSSELDRNMFERYREIQIIAGLQPFADTQASDAKKRSLLNTLQRTYPSYSWIGFADQRGIVQTSTQGLLQEQSVVERPWFMEAQSEAYVGDVHEAVLLAKLLPNPDGDIFRFVDVAAPVYDSQGAFQGVLGAHLSWQWSEEVKADLLNTDAAANKEILIVDQAGTVLLGPELWQGKNLSLDSLRLAHLQRAGNVVERWPDDQTYLVGFIKSQGYRSYPGLGWTILVYEPTATALKPAQILHRQILIGGVVLGLALAVIGWIVARLITKPLMQIATAADQIRAGNRNVTLPKVRGEDEIAKCSKALTQLITNLFDREQEICSANGELKTQLQARNQIETSLRRTEEQLLQIVDGIEDALMLREVGTGKIIYSNVGFAKLHYQSEATPSDHDDWLQWVHPDDVEWVAQKVKSEIRGEAFFDEEYRLLDADGNIRWIWDRSFPICDETGQIYRYAVIERDITELKRSTETMKTLMEGTAAATGTAFFHELVQHLAVALDADHVFLSELVDNEFRTLAFWSRGKLQPDVTYRPDNTPCSLVVENGMYSCQSQVVEEFPGNPYLVQLQAQGYVGVALVNAAGDSLGSLCILSKRPLGDRTDYVTLLKIFAHRAAAELDRQRSENALQDSEARFRLLAENGKDLVCLHDISGNFLYLSPSCESFLGYEAEELIGCNPYQYCHVEDRKLLRSRLQRIIQNGSSDEPITFRIHKKSGVYVWLESLVKVIHPTTEEPMYLQTSSRDITEKVLVQQQLEHDATHDSLTGLASRRLLLARLDLSIERAKRNDAYQFAVLFIDLDRFKVINDSLGHLAGDELLRAIAYRLKSLTRSIDLVARIGGDEFVLLLEDINGLAASVHIAERILEEFQTAISINEHEVVVGASIGLVVGEPDYTDSLDVLRDADIAMHSAKHQGKSRYTIFNPAMHQQALQRLELENALRRGIQRQEFRLRYQPIMALSKGELAGFEALVRWQHPEKGMISPADFIPIAEDTGLIVPLGAWVLKEACSQMAQWQAQFADAGDLKISVNLSVEQLKEPDIVAQIEQILNETGLTGKSLALEITESMFMQDLQVINQRLKQLNELSIQISIDDFGTGFSSLSYLHQLAVNNLKIDRSFVSNLFESRRNLDVARTIIKLSKQLGLEAIAEGIETEEQLQKLKSFGCQMGQGYLFNAPVTNEVAEGLIIDMVNSNAEQQRVC